MAILVSMVLVLGRDVGLAVRESLGGVVEVVSLETEGVVKLGVADGVIMGVAA